ncbi:MAG: xylulokinase [Pseudomonadales bacterium]
MSIDLGTTRLKVAAFAPDGALLELRARRHRDHGEGGSRWQNPDEWWQDTAALVSEVRAAVQARLGSCRVLGLSLSGRGGAAIFADAQGDVLLPPWQDDRHGPQRMALRTAFPELAPYTSALLAKCLWLRDEAPTLFARARYALYAKDFLLLRLTGAHLTDWSSGPDGPAWPAAALAELQLPATLLPRPALPWQLAGGLTPAAARLLQLPAETPVAVGAHDGICANVGAGACRPGDYVITLGTNAVVRAVTQRPSEDAYRFYCLPEDRQVVGGNAWLGGRAADWLLDLLGADRDHRDEAFASLEAAAAGVPVGASGVRFLPYLGGQVAPERHPEARGVLAGLRVDHGSAATYRAVLEGVTFAVAEVFDQVHGWAGEPRMIRLTGGGARSALWTSMLAAVLGRPLELTDGAAESRGAAVFLAQALGLHDSYDAAADAMVAVSDQVVVDAGQSAAYVDVQADWTRLRNLLRAYS